MSGTPATPGRSAAPADGVNWRRSLRTRIALWSGALNLLVLLLVTAATAWFVRDLILDNARRDTLASTEEAARRLETTLRSVHITTTGLAELVADATLDPEELITTLRALVKATPGASGGLLVLEPREGRPGFARYISADGLRDRDLLAFGYNYRRQPWFQRTLSSPGGWWSEPYRNETAGGTWTITYNMPLRPSGRGAPTRGMVSLTLPLAALTDSFESLAHLPGWRVSLVAPGGTLAANPEPGVALTQTLDQYIARSGRSDLLPAARAVRLHQPGQFTHRDTRSHEQRFTVVAPVGDSGWSLLVAQSYSLIVKRLNRALWLLAAAGTALALLCMWVVRKLAKQISRPMEALAKAAARLGEGDYGTRVAHTGQRDEVGMMARTLEHARTSIQQQLLEIGEMGAARQKLESELSIARDIQHAMLSPPRRIARGGASVEAHAVLEAAKAVGGDFYSFIERGDGELWFAIGDVSDKGVPAALFMARTVTVLEVAAHTLASPAEVLAEASRRLVEGNDTCMFATVLCGHLDVRSGHCTLANAGHDAPLLLHADGRVETLAVAAGPPLGFEVSSDFTLWHGQLEAGASLLAYTDGVTEAFNPGNEAYGPERLLAVLHAGRSAQAQCTQVLAAVHAFAGTAPQSDDITVLAIRRALEHEPLAPATPGERAAVTIIPIASEESTHADTSDRPG
ncbi:SpoIIE family protein phosphatase [Pseudoxanthomonas gei]|nr:SpoIIE family protein phosphatase [Pseudoxanthomonas gei]